MKRITHISTHLQQNKCSAHASSYDTSSLNLLEQEINGIDINLPYIAQTHSNVLTSEQIKQFEKDGYFVIKKLVTEKEINVYRDRFLKICKGEVDKQDMLVMRDVVLAKQNKNKAKSLAEEEVTKIQDWQNDEVLMEYVRSPEVLKYVRAIIGENIRSIHTMLINKPPDLGEKTSEHPMHQDLLYFPFRPTNKIVASWTAMQVINEENGCLSVIPGTHKLGLLRHIIPNKLNNMAYQGVPMDEVRNILENQTNPATGKKYEHILLDMEPGDTVFFHPCLIHGSGPNFSQHFRKAISCHYASGTCHMSQIPDHNYLLVDELFLTLSKKFGVQGKSFNKDEMLQLYQYTWKNKSRQIEGQEYDQWVPRFPSVDLA